MEIALPFPDPKLSQIEFVLGVLTSADTKESEGEGRGVFWPKRTQRQHQLTICGQWHLGLVTAEIFPSEKESGVTRLVYLTARLVM